MRHEILTESQASIIYLSDDEASALTRAGGRLASNKIWWGQTDLDKPSDRSVISCQSIGRGHWKVTVRDAVGIVSVGSLQLTVVPKIPQSHLLYLFEAAQLIPRMDSERGKIKEGESLWHLISHWYVSCCELLLRKDLLRDYTEQQDFLPVKRGRIVYLPTATAYFKGRVGFESIFEEFSIDMPLNRMLKAAVEVVLSSPLLPRSLRKRARAIIARMKDVKPLRKSDLSVSLDRRSVFYADAIQLARHILMSQGRSFGTGSLVAWTFLIRTPEMIENGIRETIKCHLADHWKVEKRGIQVGGGVTFTPDLVFDEGRVVADVKYKLLNQDWVRSDLYQIMAFATVFNSNNAAIFGFSKSDQEVPNRLRAGQVSVESLSWEIDESIEPEEAANRFCKQVEAWLRRSIGLSRLQEVK